MNEILQMAPLAGSLVHRGRRVGLHVACSGMGETGIIRGVRFGIVYIRSCNLCLGSFTQTSVSPCADFSPEL
jgi:hypothetical protein